MMKLVLRLFLIAVALLVIAFFIDGIRIDSFGAALFVSFLFAIMNMTLKPILHVITFPFILLTLGLFSIMLNGFLFWVLSLLVPGFVVGSFWAAMIGSVLLSLSSVVVHWMTSSAE